MRAARESRHHHQSPAARRANGFRPLARSAFDRAIAEGRRQTSSGALEIDAEHGTLVEVPAREWEHRVVFRVLEFTEEFMEAKNGTRNFALALGRTNTGHHSAMAVLRPLTPVDVTLC